MIEHGSYRFTINIGKPPAEAKEGTTAGKNAAFLCLMSKVPIDYDDIRKEGQAGRMGQKLMAIVAEGNRGRVYLARPQNTKCSQRRLSPNGSRTSSCRITPVISKRRTMG